MAGGGRDAADLRPPERRAARGDDPAPRLAFDHAAIIADGVERARAKLEYTSLAAAFVDEPFTLAELRRVYEAAWGVALDAPNFRRKVLSAPGFVRPVGERSVRPGGGRPAELYRRGDALVLSPAAAAPRRCPYARWVRVADAWAAGVSRTYPRLTWAGRLTT